MLRVITEITGGSGGPQWSTMHFGGTTEGEAAAAALAAAAFWADLQDTLTAAYQFHFDGEVYRVDPATNQILEVFLTAGWDRDGTKAGETLPWATQGLVRWRTGTYVAGRELRGRTFIPGWLESESGGGVPSPAAVAAMNAAGLQFLTSAAPAGGAVVYSPTHGVASAISAAQAWDRWAVLRSRRD